MLREKNPDPEGCILYDSINSNIFEMMKLQKWRRDKVVGVQWGN
jgi:hypothetical protein